AASPAPAAPRSGHPARPPRPAAPRSAPAAPRSAHRGLRRRRNPGQEAAERTQAMIIKSRPAVSKPTRRAGWQKPVKPISSAASHLNIRRRHGGLNVHMKRPVKVLHLPCPVSLPVVTFALFAARFEGSEVPGRRLPGPAPATGEGRSGGGGERGGWGRCTGAGSWLSPLPGSYSRVGSAGRLFAGRCPTLTARVGSLKTFTGIIPAAAYVSRCTAGLRGQLVISAHTKPASSRATAVTTTPGGLPRAVIFLY